MDAAAAAGCLHDEEGNSARPPRIICKHKVSVISRKHFVDEHRAKLIDRVSNIAPILDQLLERKVIQTQTYNKILTIPRTQEKIMVLYSDLLIGKGVFSRNLEKNEQYLIAGFKKEDLVATFTDPERKHFVDEHRAQLIDRVSNIAPILDQLLEKEVIQPGKYDEIRAIPTTRDKMMRLYSGPLNTAGPDDIDVFYRILERHERYLIADLKKKKPDGQHFVDEHRAQLIDEKEVIRDMPTTLNPGPLNAAGSYDSFRNIFNRIREIIWPHLIADVKKENIVEGATFTDPERPSRSLEPEGCGNVMVSSDWTELEPEVNSTDADEAPTYSLQSEAGNFECSVSGLRWVCKEKVSFKYQFCTLKKNIERIERMQYMPAGPLMDITVIAGKLDEVYLPHWICIDDNPTILDKFAVLHIDDCGDVVEKVSEVTSSHVKLSEPAFSLKMVLVKAGYSVKINSKVLIYGTKTPFFTLRVYLIPPDPGLLQQDLEKTESSDGYRRFKKPHPKKPLKMHDEFILTAELGGAEIASDTLQLLYESTEPNFSEVFIEDPVADLTLKLGKENESQPVWTCVIRQKECQSTDGPIQGQHFVDRHRDELIDRVSNIASILDQLLSKKIIQQGSYDEILAIPTNRDKMRKLFSGPLNAAGSDGKEVFYKILKKQESPLIADLKKSMW